VFLWAGYEFEWIYFWHRHGDRSRTQVSHLWGNQSRNDEEVTKGDNLLDLLISCTHAGICQRYGNAPFLEFVVVHNQC
jgi:hypothetical protein